MLNAPEHWQYEAVFDTEGRGCGDALLDLKLRMRDLTAGATILVISDDPGAPIELPAWCRMTRNAVRESHPPHFLIEKRKE